MSIPYNFNKFGLNNINEECYVFFRCLTRLTSSQYIFYESKNPIEVYVNDEYVKSLPPHESFERYDLDFNIDNSNVIFKFDKHAIWSTRIIGSCCCWYNLRPTFIQIKGYSPKYLNDLFYNCSSLTSLDIDEYELTKNCIDGWRVFADCSKLNFTPTAKYWWENSKWTR